MKWLFSIFKSVFRLIFNFRLIGFSFLFFFLFFAFYNKFLVNASTYSLSIAMREFSTMKDPSQMVGYETVIVNALTDALTEKDADEEGILELQTAKEFLSGETDARNRERMLAVLQDYADKHSKNRRGILNVLDKFNYQILKVISNVRSAATGESKDLKDIHLSPEKKGLAKKYIDEFELQKARDIYNEFLALYPDAAGSAEIYLKLAYISEISGNLDGAREAYQKVLDYFPGQLSSVVAENALRLIGEKNALLKKTRKLTGSLDDTSPPEEKQKLALQIAGNFLKLYRFEEAIQHYNICLEINSRGDIADQARRNLSWIYNFTNQKEKAFTVLREIEAKSKSKGTSNLVGSVELLRYYIDNGDMDKAIAIFNDFFKNHRSSPTTPLVIYEIGMSFLYKLNDPVRAAAYFAVLKKVYPDSKYITDVVSFNPNKTKVFLSTVDRMSRLAPFDTLRIFASSKLSKEIVEFETVFEERSLNQHMNAFLGLGDKLSSAWSKMTGGSIDMIPEENHATFKSIFTFGANKIEFNAIFELKVENGSLTIECTNAVLGSIPIPPIFFNIALKPGMETVNKITVVPYYYTEAKIVRLDSIDPVSKRNKEAIVCRGYADTNVLENMKPMIYRHMGGEIKVFKINPSEIDPDIGSALKGRYPAIYSLPNNVKNKKAIPTLTHIYARTLFEMYHNMYNISWYGEQKEFETKIYAERMNYDFDLYSKDEYPFVFDNANISVFGGKFRIDGGLLYAGFKVRIDSAVYKINAVLSLTERTDAGILEKLSNRAARSTLKINSLSINGDRVSAETISAMSQYIANLYQSVESPVRIDDIAIYKNYMVLKGLGDKSIVDRFIVSPINLFDIFREGLDARKGRDHQGREYFYKISTARYLKDYKREEAAEARKEHRDFLWEYKY